jgi:hypothetical protein
MVENRRKHMPLRAGILGVAELSSIRD